jgi:hypothetical protein
LSCPIRLASPSTRRVARRSASFATCARTGRRGGSLELTLDLGWRPEEEAEILAVVAPLLASEGIAAGEIELRPMPAHAGRVTLGVLGEGEGDEGQVAGVAELALVGSERGVLRGHIGR